MDLHFLSGIALTFLYQIRNDQLIFVLDIAE